MISVPRYLTANEKEVVLSALEPHYLCKLSLKRSAGGFKDFAQLPKAIRQGIIWNLNEHEKILQDFFVYRVVDPEEYFALGYTIGKNVLPISENLKSPLSGRIVELAKEIAKPWSLRQEARRFGLFGAVVALCLMYFGLAGYFQYNTYWGLALAAIGIFPVLWAFLVRPILYGGRSSRVLRALLALGVTNKVPEIQSTVPKESTSTAW